MKLKAIASWTGLAVALVLCVGSAQAQMYRWTDANGRIHYSDVPPPPGQKVEVKNLSGGTANVELPFELSEAVRRYPITLYTSSPCEICDTARNLLRGRGIPYAEKTVSTAEDQARLKEVGGNGQVPVLLIGQTKLLGFEAGSWNGALDNARYPNRNMLPSTFQYAAAEPAAPPRKAAEVPKAAAKADESGESKPKPPVNAPPDFQF